MGVHPAGAPTPCDSVRHALGLSGEKDQFLTHLSPSMLYRDLWCHELRRRDSQEHVVRPWQQLP